MRKPLFLLLASLSSAAPAWAAEGDWDRAKSAHERGDYATELAIIRPMADKGYPFAQFNMGVLYDEGKGVAEDNAKAIDWYRKAADQEMCIRDRASTRIRCHSELTGRSAPLSRRTEASSLTATTNRPPSRLACSR